MPLCNFDHETGKNWKMEQKNRQRFNYRDDEEDDDDDDVVSNALDVMMQISFM